jgi:hypothetical protein
MPRTTDLPDQTTKADRAQRSELTWRSRVPAPPNWTQPRAKSLAKPPLEQTVFKLTPAFGGTRVSACAERHYCDLVQPLFDRASTANDSGSVSGLAKDAERIAPQHAEIALDHLPALFDGDLARLLGAVARPPDGIVG